MPPTKTTESDSVGWSRVTTWLAAIGLASAVLYGWISRLSFQFQVDTTHINIPNVDRPLATVLVLFAILFALYFVAVELIRRSSVGGSLGIIIAVAILFRVIGWYSNPIQEVDIYRYMWDGVVSTQGISPFRYPPLVVVEAVDGKSELHDPQLEKLRDVCESDPAIAEILRRVHYPKVPTVYPSVSQVVFAVATYTTPAKATLTTRLRMMKAWLVLFDLATLYLVVRLLATCGLRRELCIAYGWCPLLFKEVANSGHLDSIAVFLTTLAVFLVAKYYYATENHPSRKVNRVAGESIVGVSGRIAILAAICLALAVAAKLYPIVLVPLFALAVARRMGWRRVMLPAAAFVMTALFALWPMLPSRAESVDTADPSDGVRAFLRSWEMNDFLFMVVVENLKPTSSQTPAVWFSVLPDGMRAWFVGLSGMGHVGAEIPVAEYPFFATRIFTSLCFLALAIVLAIRHSRKAVEETTANKSVLQLCVAAFLTIAWFWLLSPTQNPWYWTWALPFLPFMRNRAWYAMSGLAMLYYTRFWFEYHGGGTPVLGTPYQGALFFDFVVTWIEFAPWFAWLGISALLFKGQSKK